MKFKFLNKLLATILIVMVFSTTLTQNYTVNAISIPTDDAQFRITSADVTSGIYGAYIDGECTIVDANANSNLKVLVSENASDFDDLDKSISSQLPSSIKKETISYYNNKYRTQKYITGLKPNTTYYYVIANDSRVNALYDNYLFFAHQDIKSFTTQSTNVGQPTVSVSSKIRQIGAKNAEVIVTVENYNRDYVVEIGVDYADNAEMSGAVELGNDINYYNEDASVTLRVPYLNSQTLYYREYVKTNFLGTETKIYGNVHEANKLQKPSAITLSNVKPGTYIANVEVDITGFTWEYDYTYQFQYSENQDFSSDKTFYPVASTTTQLINNLESEKTYYVRAVLIDENNENIISNTVTITTLPDVIYTQSDITDPILYEDLYYNFGSNGALHRSDLEKQNYYDYDGSNRQSLTNLDGLKYLPNLETLYIQRCGAISDIAVLSELPRLRYLAITDGLVNDIQIIAQMKGLSTLSLYGNRITDASGISALTTLESLNLENNQLTELPDLHLFTNLKTDFVNNSGYLQNSVSFKGNKIPESEFTTAKLPVAFVEDHLWKTKEMISQRQQSNIEVVVSDVYFSNGNLQPFFLEMKNVPKSTYKIELDFGNDQVCEDIMDFDIDRNISFLNYEDISDYLDGQSTISLGIKITDELNNHEVIVNETTNVSFSNDTDYVLFENHFLNENPASFPINFTVNQIMSSELFQKVMLKKANTEIVVASTLASGTFYTSTQNESQEQRYSDAFESVRLPNIAEVTRVHAILYRMSEMTEGNYDLYYTYNNVEYVIEDAIEVTQRPVVIRSQSYVENFPNTRSDSEYVYVSVSGRGIDPEQIIPTLSTNGIELSEVMGYRNDNIYNGELNYIYKLKRLNQYEAWPRNAKLEIKNVPNDYIIDDNDKQEIYFSDLNGEIYYIDYDAATNKVNAIFQNFEQGTVTAKLCEDYSSSDTPLSIVSNQVVQDSKVEFAFKNPNGSDYSFEPYKSYYVEINLHTDSNIQEERGYYFYTGSISAGENNEQKLFGNFSTQLAGATEVPVTVYFPESITTQKTIKAKLIKDNVVYSNEIILTTNMVDLDNEGVPMPHVEATGTLIPTQTLNEGNYTIEFLVDDQVYQGKASLLVYAAGKVYTYAAYGSIISDTSMECNVYNYGGALDTNKFEVEIKDFRGNVVTGYTLNTTEVYENSFNLMITNLPAGNMYYSLKVKYDGHELLDYSDVSKSIYEGRDFIADTFKKNNDGYFYCYSNNNNLGLMGVSGDESKFPVTLQISKPYSIDTLKTVTINESRAFITTDFSGLALGNEKYDIVIFDRSGKIIDNYDSQKIIAKSINQVAVRGVSLNKASTSIQASTQEQLIATVVPTDASDKSLIWTTSNSQIATVNSSGVVSAISEGTATVTVRTYDGNYTATCEIVVTPAPIPVTGVQLNKDSIKLLVGMNETLSATVEPTNASNKGVEWQSSNPQVATVNSSGKITAIAEGTAIITVRTLDQNLTTTCTVIVNVPAGMSTGLKYANDTEITKVGNTYQINGIYYPQYESDFDEETNKPLKITVTGTGSDWENNSTYQIQVLVNNTEKKLVNKTGTEIKTGITVELLRENMSDGNNTITINLKKDNELIATQILPVAISGSIIAVTGLNLSKTEMTLKINENQSLYGEVQPFNATNKGISWTSSDTEIASVSNNGVIKGLSAGTVTISAITSHRGYEKTAVVHVGANIAGKVTKDSIASPNTWVFLYTSNHTFINSVMSDANGNYNFSGVLVGSYEVKTNIYQPGYSEVIQSVNVVEKDVTVSVPDMNCSSKYALKSTLTIQLRDELDHPYSEDAWIYVNNYETGTYIYRQITSQEKVDETVSIADLLYATGGTTYTVAVSADGYWKSEEVNINAQTISKTYTIPVRYTVAGTLTTNEQAVVPNTWVMLSNVDDFTTYSGYTNAQGEFTIYGLPVGSYELMPCDQKKFIFTPVEVEVTNQDLVNQDLVVTKGADLIGKVLKGNLQANAAYIQLYKIVNSVEEYVSGGYAGQDGFILDSAIKETGNYRLKINFIKEKNGTYPMFVSTPLDFTVTTGDIESGRISQNISYADPVNTSEVFKGNGNYILSDISTVRTGSTVNMIIKYKNNGNTAVNADFAVTLPTGVTTTNNQNAFSINGLAPQSSGQKSIPLTIGNVTDNNLDIPVKVTVGGTEYSFGSVSLEVANVSLNGPSAVKTGTDFKVYGETPIGSTIVIKDVNTGRVLATAVPSGRWYSATINLEQENEYTLVAETEVDHEIVISKVLHVSAKTQQLSLVHVSGDSEGATQLPINKVIGARAFTAWVDSSLNGRDIFIASEFDNPGIIQSVTYHFSGNDYIATKNQQGYYVATLNNWSGAGLKTITATVVTTDHRTLNYIIAEVTVLVDPSGYVTDQETGARLPGVTVICEVSTDNGATWSTWNAELYGQANPQISDVNGNYGWMTPEGLYRVRAIKNGYNEYVTTNDPDPNIATIVIPPVRSDVNFSIVPTVLMQSVSMSALTADLTVGATKALTAVALPSDATNKNKIQWTTSNSNIASVDANGLVTAKAAGTVTISAVFTKANNTTLSDSCVITVTSVGNNQGESIIPIMMGGVMPTTTPAAVVTLKKTFELDKEGILKVKAADIATKSALLVESKDLTIAFDAKSLSILKNYTELTFSVKKVNSAILSKEDQVKVGDRPLFDISITSDGKAISSFGEGVLKVQIPYTLKPGENPNAIVVYYINSKGKLEAVQCVYADGILTFKTNHLSQYAVGYNPVNFNDVTGWYAEYVAVLAAQGIVNGNVNKQFEPTKNITRAEFIQLIANFDGAIFGSKDSHFKDVQTDKWYFNAIQWAYEKGIVNGTSIDKFSPNALITREDMAAIIYRYCITLAKYELPKKIATQTFADEKSLSNYALDAVKKMQQAGLISGKEHNQFAPKEKATKAEVAKILALLLKLMME